MMLSVATQRETLQDRTVPMNPHEQGSDRESKQAAQTTYPRHINAHGRRFAFWLRDRTWWRGRRWWFRCLPWRNGKCFKKK